MLRPEASCKSAWFSCCRVCSSPDNRSGTMFGLTLMVILGPGSHVYRRLKQAGHGACDPGRGAIGVLVEHEICSLLIERNARDRAYLILQLLNQEIFPGELV